jgi:hypothetical protein
MKAGDRYFMAAVDLLTVKNRIEGILQGLNEHQAVPSIELMAACIEDLTKAMITTHRERLSDPRFKIVPQCQVPGCWNNGDQHVCKDHSVQTP